MLPGKVLGKLQHQKQKQGLEVDKGHENAKAEGVVHASCALATTSAGAQQAFKPLGHENE